MLCRLSSNKFIAPLLAVLGLGVLFGDIAADLVFFSDPNLRTWPLMGSALLRNGLTASALVALFFNREWAAGLLVGVGVLGGWRRVSFLAPLASQGQQDQWLLVHSGVDVAFRCLLIGIGIGYFLGRAQSAEGDPD